jgi:high-affinity nickel-transport protein
MNPRRHQPRRSWRGRLHLTRGERRQVVLLAAAVGGLHLAGFLTLLIVTPQHASAGAGVGFGLGIGITAYTLGLRHAFDADHISAIDNTTRKLMGDGERPLSVGFWFSLGHSTVVFALTFLIVAGIRSLEGSARNGHSSLHQLTGWIGTSISGTFLYVIAILNMVIFLGIVKVFREMKTGRYDEAALEQRLSDRGLMNRFFGRLAGAVTKPHHMYPVGVLFGLGFNTASEVGLLAIAASAGRVSLPWYAILCLPVLFAAGMSLFDTIDGSFMNFAYGWAFTKPVRKVFYNLTVTALSVGVALVIGTIELGSLVAQHLDLSGGFWHWFENIDVNLLGIMIVTIFVVTWILALLVWRLWRIEERWGVHLQEGPSQS